MSAETPRTGRSRVIRASEIGEYVWCHRAWWLGRVRGVPNANRVALDAGTERHRQHGRAVARADTFSRWARRMVILVAALLLVLLIALALGLH